MSNSKVSLSDLDRSIGIFTAINSYHSRKLNEQILIQQYKSNSHLSELSKQMDSANATNRKILQNQIQEIENKEKQKFYKALSFNINEIIEQLEKVKDPMVLNYLMDNYYEKTKTSLLTAIDTLDEINDKLFNKQILERLGTLKTNSNLNLQDYSKNVLSKIDYLLLDLKEQEDIVNKLKSTRNIQRKPRKKTNRLRIFGILICGFFILTSFVALMTPENPNEIKPKVPIAVTFSTCMIIFGIPFILLVRQEIKWRKEAKKDEILQIRNQIEIDKQQNEEIKKYEEIISHHPVVHATQEINSNHPTFQSTLTEITALQTAFEKRFSHSDTNGNTKALKNLDQMFEQCARLVVSSGSGSTSMLQRRFNLGYNRAGRIMEQLESAGIVGSGIGGKPRELLINSESDLNEILISIMK